MKKKYIIRNFAVLPVSENHIVLHNDFGVVRITNQDIIKLLLRFDKEKLIEYSFENFTDCFKEENLKVIKFLEKYGVIEEKANNNFEIENLLLISNDEPLSGNIQEFVSEKFNFNYVNIKSIESLNIPSNTLCFVFLNPYSRKTAKKIRDKFLQNTGSYLMISYLYHNQLYIDSPYHSEWKSPCHLCQLGIIEEELRDSLNNNNFQSFIDNLYEKEPDFQIETILSKSQILNVTTTIVNRIEQFCGINKFNYMNSSEINKGIVMNLDHNYKRMDTTIHWELCDCY